MAIFGDGGTSKDGENDGDGDDIKFPRALPKRLRPSLVSSLKSQVSVLAARISSRI